MSKERQKTKKRRNRNADNRHTEKKMKRQEQNMLKPSEDLFNEAHTANRNWNDLNEWNEQKNDSQSEKKAYYNNNSHIGTDDDTKVNILIGVYMWFDPFSFYYSFHYLFLDFRSLFISFHIFLHVYTCFLDCFFFRHRCCCWSSVLSCLCMKTVDEIHRHT